MRYQRAQPSINSQNKLVKLEVSYRFSVPDKTRMIQLIVLLPQTIPNRQKIVNIESTPSPARTIHRNGNTYAEYQFTRPDSHINIDISIEAELYRYDLSTASGNPQPVDLDSSGLAGYLVQEKYIEKNDPAIQAVAHDIAGNADTDIVKNIYDYVLDHMEYVKLGSKDLGAVTSLRYGKGDCTEYSDLFVAICRAKGIPARIASSYAMGNNATPTRHSWAEAYLKDIGWVPFEISGADVPSVTFRNRAFRNMMTYYMYFSYIRNDAVLNNFQLCVYKFWGDKPRLTDTVTYKQIATVVSSGQ